MPTWIAINPETKECGYFWGGDEYGGFHLSSSWRIVYPNTPIQTEVGVFEWDGSSSSIENFCKQIGYTYVSGNLGEVRGHYRYTIIAIILLVIKFCPLIIVFFVLFAAPFLIIRWATKHGKNASTSR
jgi:hypothetical protein